MHLPVPQNFVHLLWPILLEKDLMALAHMGGQALRHLNLKTELKK